MKVGILYKELQKFGIKEVYWHLLNRLTHSEKSLTGKLIEKDKYYQRLSFQGMKTEIEDTYETEFNHTLNLMNPELYSEKIQWLKLYDNTPEKAIFADKFLVREWIKDKIGEKYLIKLLGAWDSFEDIDFSVLPSAFCLKMNHGSGMNYVVNSKDDFDIDDARKKFKLWISRPFYADTLELQYKNMPRKILAEEYIEDNSGKLLDYKFHCFDGQPRIIQVIGERDFKNHTAKEIILDQNWEKNGCMYGTYDSYDIIPPKPSKLDEMLEIARRLSDGFCYVRVDLYEINGEIKFGEMTFTPASGLGKWRTIEEDRMIGNYINLPES